MPSGDQPSTEEKEMSFVDHLEELRWHVIRSVSAILIFTVVAFLNKYLVFHELLLGPSRPDFLTYRLFCKLGDYLHYPEMCIQKLDFIIQSRQMTGQFTTHLTVSFFVGTVVAFPYIFWELWRFIRPGLYSTERSVTRGAVAFVSILFITGILFGYYILSPLSINFLANYKVDESIENQIDLVSYMSTLVMMVLACGLMFQLPMVVLVLSKIGILTPAFMRAYRRHAFLVILIVSAILTPSPDAFSQMLVAIPLYFLYEMSIFISAREAKKRRMAPAD
jgi:sec-independent protein translocase protein TatC